MGIAPDVVKMGRRSEDKSDMGKKKDDEGAVHIRCGFKFRFFERRASSRRRIDGSMTGIGSQDVECNSPNDASRDESVAPVLSSTMSNADSCKSPNDASRDESIALILLPSTTSNTESIPLTPTKSEELKISSQLRRFDFNELKLATRNFRADGILGHGGFGCVFKGLINESGTTPRLGSKLTVAVKILNHYGLQGHREWLAEIYFLGDLIHPNLVKLIGYCIEDDQRLLVYEFMPRGSLENHLFRRLQPLPWSIRMKILLDAAKGLAFLHEEAERPVIYRDFKTSNILLDAEYNAKLSDFGLAKDGPEGDKTHVTTRVMGTYGYAAPEYVMTGHLTPKSDVYSFGIVLLEMLSGRKSIDKNRRHREQNLVEWARPYLRERRGFYWLIDPRLAGQFSIKGAHKVVMLAACCLNLNPKARPLMSEVVEALKPLPDLNDMAGSSSLQVLQDACAGISPNARSGIKLNNPHASQYHHHHPCP